MHQGFVVLAASLCFFVLGVSFGVTWGQPATLPTTLKSHSENYISQIPAIPGHSAHCLKNATESDVLQPSGHNALHNVMCLNSSAVDNYLPRRCCDSNIPLFYDVALRHGTDKVTAHAYHYMYQDFIAPLRCREGLRFMEIGLGCGMTWGAGRSVTMWMEYLPHVDIIVEVEYDGACLDEFRKAWMSEPAPWVLTNPASWAKALECVAFEQGDQSSEQSMKTIGNKHGPFDIVIDDGGHSRKQQIMSLASLWPYVRPGGFYVVEDLLCSFKINKCPNTDDWGINAMQYIFAIQEAILGQSPRAVRRAFDRKLYVGIDAILDTVKSVHCYPHACVLVKKLAEPPKEA